MATVTTFPKRWLRRIGWLVLIWIVSVLMVSVIALLFRMMMSLAGLTT
jgi:hypothetical protein